MTNDQDSDFFKERHWLDKLVKLANKHHQGPFVMPSEEVIKAYLSGEATETERAEVIAALSNSSEFRREIKEMADDLEAISAISDEKKTERDSNIQVPDLSEHLGYETEITVITDIHIEPRPSVPINIALGGVEKSSHRNRKTSWLRDYRFLLPVLAAAALVVIVAIPLLKDNSGLRLVSKAIDKEPLMSLNLRGAIRDSTDSKSVETPQQVAIACLSKMMIVEDFELRINPKFERLPMVDGDCSTCLFIHHSGQVVAVDFAPSQYSGKNWQPHNLQAWLMSFPSRKLWSTDIENRKTIDWIPKFGPTLLVAFTYESDGQYLCEPGIIVTKEIR